MKLVKSAIADVLARVKQSRPQTMLSPFEQRMGCLGHISRYMHALGIQQYHFRVLIRSRMRRCLGTQRYCFCVPTGRGDEHTPMVLAGALLGLWPAARIQYSKLSSCSWPTATWRTCQSRFRHIDADATACMTIKWSNDIVILVYSG